GLTTHRAGLHPLRILSGEEAADALLVVEQWQDRYLESRGQSTVYAADELYLLAGKPLPPFGHYGEFPQIENGVGLLRVFEADLIESASRLAACSDQSLSVAVITGHLASPFIEEALESIAGHLPGLEISVHPVDNSLLGSTVTVAGLLPGRDMVGAVLAAADADLILLPAVAFNRDGLTIDGMTASQVAEAAERGLNEVVPTDDIVDAILHFINDERLDAPDRGSDDQRE
ncbi:MAG: DUF512 domain-containing protein, partial [Candidatus Eisenbacteria bacterium]|nr:DUF512 domain-containing protein [Candidatus Eisenbacteria bacterium]